MVSGETAASRSSIEGAWRDAARDLAGLSPQACTQLTGASGTDIVLYFVHTRDNKKLRDLGRDPRVQVRAYS